MAGVAGAGAGHPVAGLKLARLGADGEEILARALYFPVAAYNRKTGFCRKSVAYTTVGGTVTCLCPEFSGLSDERDVLPVIGVGDMER